MDNRQYFKKKQFIDCYTYGVSKMMEFSWIGNEYILAIEAALSPGGIWYGDSVWFEGDYNEPNSDVDNRHNIYHFVRKSWENMKVPCLSKHNQFIINDTTGQFLNIYGNNNQIHPLPILLANSTGCGGGDYNGTNEHLVGSWAGDSVYTSNVIAPGYEEVAYQFESE